MGSVSKLWAVPSFFSQTMSRWPCSRAMGAPSRPACAGLRTTMLPTLSCTASRPSRPLARARTRAPPLPWSKREVSPRTRQSASIISLGSRSASAGVITRSRRHLSASPSYREAAGLTNRFCGGWCNVTGFRGAIRTCCRDGAGSLRFPFRNSSAEMYLSCIVSEHRTGVTFQWITSPKVGTLPMCSRRRQLPGLRCEFVKLPAASSGRDRRSNHRPSKNVLCRTKE